MTMVKAEKMYEDLAEVLPYEIQSTLLAIRDSDDLQKLYNDMPVAVYFAMRELSLIEGEDLKLTNLGKHLVNYCTC